MNDSLKQKIRKNWQGYLFVLPVIAVISFFKIGPMFTALSMSFFRWDGVTTPDFIGLDNFRRMIGDSVFRVSLVNIGILTLAGVASFTLLPFIAAVLVRHIKNGFARSIYRLFFIVPMVVPTIVTFLMWRWIYDMNFGVLNQLLVALGLESFVQPWLGQSSTALLSIIFVNFPWIGTIGFLIFLAGLQSISTDLYEVTKIDGISAWKRLLFLEIPLVKSQFRLVIVLAVIQFAQSFENILILTNGGPGNSTMVPALYMYTLGFMFNEMGYASSIGVTLFVLILAVTIFNQIMIKNTEAID